MKPWLTPIVRARLILALALMLGVVTFASTSAAYATTISVACDPAALIAAINQANSTPEADTLNLASGCTYTLTAGDNFTDGENGLPTITSPITIAGNGSTIERSSVAGTPGFRLVEVVAGGDLTLQALTVCNGQAGDGGGLRNQGGTLALTHVTVSGNTATSGGGGGIFNEYGGTLTVSNSTLSSNSANQDGGGILNYGTLTVQNSTLSGNSATYYYGGGIYNKGTLTITNSTLSSNSANQDGGGILNYGGR